MLISRLGFMKPNLCKINRFSRSLFQRNYSNNEMDDSKPLPYLTSEAAKWKAEYSRSPPYEYVWYTPYVVMFSLSSFLIYFCILREENDLDEIIYQSLSKTVPGIEK